MAALAAGLVTVGHVNTKFVSDTSPTATASRSSVNSPVPTATTRLVTAAPATQLPETPKPATPAPTTRPTSQPATPRPAPPPTAPPTPPPCGHWLSISLSYATSITVDGVVYGNVVNINPISPGAHTVVVKSPQYDGQYNLIGYYYHTYVVTVPVCGGYIWHA